MGIVELTVRGGIFILGITAFRMLALRRLPKETFTALWWAAALRLLIPLELPSRLSVYTFLEAQRPKPEPVPVPTVTRPAPVLVIPNNPALPSEPLPKPFPLWTVLWIGIGLLLALWFAARYVRWRLRFRESLPAECANTGKIQLRVTDRITAPLTYGILRPVILLPKTLDLMDKDALACVLAHEQAHIRHLDGLFKLVLAAALCVHWYNPAAWLMYVLANRDMELRCDEAAVRALGGDARERYALALIRLVETRSECMPLCGFSRKSGMEERIKAIMSIQKKSVLACVLALALALGITTAFATSAKPLEAPGREDLTDTQLLAKFSAETAAQWDKTLAPYVPFGLTYKFEDPDHDGNGLTMAFEGHEVRSIFNEQTGVWITEHTGNGSYGPDAVDLYVVYENGKPIGLRLATDEEQANFDRDRKLSTDAWTIEILVNSVRYESGSIYFTIPDGEEIWSIFIQGRVMTEDGMGMSVHYLTDESERAEWKPGMTYSFETAEAAYDELSMEIAYGSASYFYDLTQILPKDGKPLPVTPLPEGKKDIPEDGSMIWPVDGGKVTNFYGDRTKPGGEGVVTHSGVDIGGLEAGAPVYAAGDGTVKDAGFNAQYGNYVRLDHGNRQETLYAHCQSLLVKTGDSVTCGQTIAKVGSTGMSTGPHLHFEFLVDGVATDPLAFSSSIFNHSLICPTTASQGSPGEGEDWAGRPIIAILDGTVLDAGEKTYGHPLLKGPYAEILYEDGYSIKFTACQSVLVKTGDTVKAGDIIGYTGDGASATGPSSPEMRELDAKIEAEDRARMEVELVDGDYPRNSRGETYGRDYYEYLGHSPELLAAYATNGQLGYVYYVEMTGLDPLTWKRVDGVPAQDIPVYDLEGNEIGIFHTDYID